jgi:cytochrome c oxidase accessory protein FixG
MANTAPAQSPKPNPAAEEETLYAKRQKIYPRAVHGIFAMWRTIGVFVLLGLYYGVPWLQWQGRQAVLLDLPERKFYIFSITFWPQDFFYLAVLLMIAALSLFFFTALAGRLWCGFACPQTVWTEVFLWIERKIEGDRPKQMKLDQAPWTARKFLIKGGKHAAWIIFAAYTGFTFVGYFTPIHGLWDKIITLNMGPWESFWIVFYSVATYGNAGWLREQVCIYMCPYARFQSAMFDRDTLIISYDPERGEPRGSRKKGVDHHAAGLGDCIDCTLCVQVCPTGIDIRNGLQYQCIACASCVDVCDQVMDQMGYPRGLVRYTTENAMEGKQAHIVRPRMIVYALILLGMLSGLGYAMLHRTPLELDVIRDRNTLYRETNEGLIENVYTLKILNMDDKAHEYRLSASGIEGLQLRLDRRHDDIRVPAGEVNELVVRLRADPYALKKRSTAVTFTIQAEEDKSLKATEPARFLGPIPGSR